MKTATHVTSPAAADIRAVALAYGFTVSYADDLTGNAITVELGAGHGVQLYQRDGRVAIYTYSNGKSTRSNKARALQAIVGARSNPSA